MANIKNNPWIEERKRLLKSTDKRPFVKELTKNQHRYVARRTRDGSPLVGGVNYEELAKRVYEGSVIKEIIPTQPMRANKGIAYTLQYRSDNDTENENLLHLEIFSHNTASTEKSLEVKFSKDYIIDTVRKLESEGRPIPKDLNEELMDVLTASIVHSHEASAFDKLLHLAHAVPAFDYAKVLGSENIDSSYTPVFFGDRLRNLSLNLGQAANNIGAMTKRGVGNWIVCSPMIVCLLQASSYSMFTPANPKGFKGPCNTMLVGKLNGMIDVYSHLWKQTDWTKAEENILVGFKGGSGELDGGLIWCPHVMVTHGRKYQEDGKTILPFGMKDDWVKVSNAADYYAKMKVINLAFA